MGDPRTRKSLAWWLTLPIAVLCLPLMLLGVLGEEIIGWLPKS